MTWHELEPGVLIDSEQRWVIFTIHHPAFTDHWRMRNIRTDEMSCHATLRAAKLVAEEE